jgi:GDPmannose 4,6-dehydratase
MSNTKKIIISGALGQDGIILSKILVKKKFSVYGFINKEKKNKLENVIYKKINFNNIKEIENNLKKIKPTHFVHFGSENPNFNSKNNYFTKNYKFTKNIIDAILRTNKNINFIFPNSSQIFKKKTKVNEQSSIYISDTYTKFRVKIFNYMMSLKKNNFRFSNLILFNHDSIFRNKNFLLPRLVKSIVEKDYKFIKKIYKENLIGDFSHAEDICKAIYLLIKKNECFNNIIISSNVATNVNDIINFLIKKNNNKVKIDIKPNINRNYIIGDNSLAKRRLNWKLKKNIFQAADEMMKNYVK